MTIVLRLKNPKPDVAGGNFLDLSQQHIDIIQGRRGRKLVNLLVLQKDQIHKAFIGKTGRLKKDME